MKDKNPLEVDMWNAEREVIRLRQIEFQKVEATISGYLKYLELLSLILEETVDIENRDDISEGIMDDISNDVIDYLNLWCQQHNATLEQALKMIIELLKEENSIE